LGLPQGLPADHRGTQSVQRFAAATDKFAADRRERKALSPKACDWFLQLAPSDLSRHRAAANTDTIGSFLPDKI